MVELICCGAGNNPHGFDAASRTIHCITRPDDIDVIVLRDRLIAWALFFMNSMNILQIPNGGGMAMMQRVVCLKNLRPEGFMSHKKLLRV